MYCSYALAVAILLPMFFFFQWLLPSWPGVTVALVAVLPYVPLTPLVFRYSRVLWIFFEDYVEPSGLFYRNKGRRFIPKER
jgi:membrane protein YdbS with pleckstrin-like domain